MTSDISSCGLFQPVYRRLRCPAQPDKPTTPVSPPAPRPSLYTSSYLLRTGRSSAPDSESSEPPASPAGAKEMDKNGRSSFRNHTLLQCACPRFLRYVLCFLSDQRAQKQIWVMSPLTGCAFVRGGGPGSDEEPQASTSGRRM